MTLIGSNVREDTLTLFLSIDEYNLGQLTFKWRGNVWEFKDCTKVIDFTMKKEEKSAEEYITELDKQCSDGIQQFADLLFGSSKDK